MSIRERVLKWLATEPKSSVSRAERKSWDSIFLKGKRFNSGVLDKPYAQHSVVYQAVNIIASNIASTPYIFYQGDQQVYDHPLDQLLDRPNDMTSRFQLFQSTAVFLQLNGEAFWVIIKSVGQELGRPGARPAELYVVDPAKMKHVVDDQGQITGWVFDSKLPLDVEEVVHMKRFNPYDPYRGLSPLSAARMAMETDWQAQVYNREFFKNDGTPGGILEVPGEEPLRDDEFNRLRAQFQNKYAGTQNAHKIMILSEGMQYKPLSITHIDMDFINQRQFSRDEILATFGVPKTVAGYTEGINRATAEMQRKNFWVETLLPQMTLIEQAIAHRLMIPYAPGYKSFFDRDAIEELRPDLKNKAEIADKLWRMGVPMDQLNERLDLGFQEFQGWNTSWLGFNVVPADPEKDIGGSSPTRSEQEIAADEPEPDKAIAMLEDEDDKQALWEEKLAKKLSRYLFEQRVAVLKGEVVWKDEEARLIKLVSPIFKEIYLEAPMLLGPRLHKICGLTRALEKQLSTDATSDQVKEIYNEATKRTKSIARYEIQTAFDEMAALRS